MMRSAGVCLPHSAGASRLVPFFRLAVAAVRTDDRREGIMPRLVTSAMFKKTLPYATHVQNFLCRTLEEERKRLPTLTVDATIYRVPCSLEELYINHCKLSPTHNQKDLQISIYNA